MRTSRSWDGCLVIPGGELAITVTTFVFVIILVIIGAALKVSGTDIGNILIGAGTVLGALLAAARRRRAAGSAGGA
ncbi:hypothetical protein ACPCHT_25015 [Nucisporomicrobium flavum]|uniref:hypothetical protein n=1 Tax=Nucisporomicrobium flavum TaxID=2785915 RepID=UPI003C2EDAD1